MAEDPPGCVNNAGVASTRGREKEIISAWVVPAEIGFAGPVMSVGFRGILTMMKGLQALKCWRLPCRCGCPTDVENMLDKCLTGDATGTMMC